MGELRTLQNGATLNGSTFTANQLQLIQKTVAPDLYPNEFDLFIEQCRIYGLNPITKQIYAIPYGKGDKRRVTLITSISGMRSIAYRTDRYRADDEESEYETDESAKCAQTNPHGIVKCKVRVYQRHGDQWFKITGAAYWDEFAPIEDEWKWGDKKGEKVYTGKRTLSGKWSDMPRHMIAKCAEAIALRKAFPELEGLYEQSEMDQAAWDMAPASEVMEAQNVLDRRAIVGDKHIIIAWSPNDQQEAVPSNELCGRLMDFYNQIQSLDVLTWFRSFNQESLKAFWAERPDEALACKEAAESNAKRLQDTLEGAA